MVAPSYYLRRRNIARASFVVRALVFILFISSSFTVSYAQDLLRSSQGRETVFQAMVDVFKENYWDAAYIDWDEWANKYRDAALNASSRRSFDGVARRMVFELEDEHSSWVGRVVYVDSDTAVPRADGRPGLGFQHNYLEGSGVVLSRVYPQTPAANAGLQRGDVIETINDQDVRNLGGQALAGRMFARAVDAGDVLLEVRRGQQLLDVLVEPAPIRFGEVQNLPQGQMLDSHTGYIYIPTFNAGNVANEVHRLTAELQSQGADALVLDLRDNLGGRLSEMGLVLGAFIDGTWAQATSRGGIAWYSSYAEVDGMGVTELISPDGESISRSSIEAPVRFDGKLAVIVSSSNSSAGEIAPLVLRNQGRATIIGEATGGNVEAVRGFDLPDGSVVMVAVANVESIDGTPFDGGVIPDIEASSNLEELARGYDAPVAEALRSLRELSFTPNKFF
ncbi:MAG: S41 family peptidase [Deinococcota bacterium]